MTKLTNDMRGRIVNAVMHHRFDTDIASLAADYAALAETVYVDAFRTKGLARMNDLPEGWLPLDSDIQAQFGTGVQTLRFNGQFVRGKWSELRMSDGTRISSEEFVNFADWPDNIHRRFPNNKKGTCVVAYDAIHVFSLRVDELNARKVDMVVNYIKLNSDTAATIAKFTTVEKLLETWPEIEPFTKGVVAKTPVQLPAVPVMHLNEMLGLPVDNGSEAHV